MAYAPFYTRLPLTNSVRNDPGLFCQGCARSVPSRCTPPTPMFFVSVDSKILRVSVSHSFSTLTRQITSVDSKGFAWAERDPFLPGQKRATMYVPSYERILYWKNYQGSRKSRSLWKRRELGNGQARKQRRCSSYKKA